jgi:hypothetical protein
MTEPTKQEPRGTGKPSLGSSRPGGGFPRGRPIWILAAVILPVLLIAGYILLSRGGSDSGPSLDVYGPGDPTAAALRPSKTPDACAVEIVRPEVEKMHALMLEFYDASALASKTPPDRLILVIPSLQEIRRRTDAVKVSDCLKTLKELEVAHMNTVINTMLAFMSNADAGLLVEGVVQARLLNEEYRKEKARLLGEEYVPPPTQAFTPTPSGTMTVLPSATP